MRRPEYYEVFARYEPNEPLRHVGTVRAKHPKDAEVFAYTLYDEWKWREMFVVPREAMVWIKRPE